MPTPNTDENLDTLPPSGEETGDSNAQETGHDDQQSGKKSAESRINQLIAENKKLEDKINGLEVRIAPPPPPPGPVQRTPELERAAAILKDLGFVQKDELTSEIQTLKDRTVLDNLHYGLERQYDGADGRPAYNRSEVEQFMRDHGVYDPQIAYDQLHKAEILDWTIKQNEGKKKEPPYIEKPGSAATHREDNSITREKIAEWMKTPEGRAKYEQNREKILTLLQNGQL